MIVKIFLSPINYTLDTLYRKNEGEFLIGVEKGAYNALQKGLELDLVLGDFDSVTEEEYDYIRKNAKALRQHGVRKDKTDSDLAITEALSREPERIIVYGGTGRRTDHTYVNLLLMKRGNITFLSDTEKLFVLRPGTYGITHDHEHISFFAIEDVKGLSLKGFSYPLEDYDLDTEDPLCISNHGEGVVSFEAGRLLVIETSE